MNRSCMTAVVIGEDLQSISPDFLKSLFTAECVYISAIEYIELLSLLMEASWEHRWLSPQTACICLWCKSNLHHLG